MRTINNMIAEVLIHNFPAETAGTSPVFTGKTSVSAVNLLYMYNTQFSAELTADQAITTPAFIRYAAFQMSMYSDRLTRMSTLFNAGGMQRFTPKNLQHVVMLAEFAAAADIYLQSDTFHDQYTRLLEAERVPYWQGSGTDYSLAMTSSINVIPSSESEKETPTPVSASGILGVIFDRDALGVTNLDRRVRTEYNPKAEFTNYFYKQDAGYFNDLNENFVVFYIA